MDRASIAISRAGNPLMRKPVLAVAFVAAMACWATAFAQDAPLRGVGLLALNASGDSDSSGLGSASPQSSRHVMVESPDEGGGGDPRHLRGSGDVGAGSNRAGATPKVPDALPPSAVPQASDPTSPAAAVPKRPNYRWQSLVPGAIK